jgi:uncharacterized protein (TIGR03382 family)
VAGLVLASGSASASVSQVCFSIRATAIVDGVPQTALFEVDSGQMYYDEPSQTYGWDLQSPFEMRSAQNTLLATLNEGSVRAIEDPVVGLNFSVQSGAFLTTFQVVSTLVGFAPIVGATGLATGTLVGDDRNGNGVVLSPLGNFPGNAVYVAKYNNSGLPFQDLDGLTFAGLFVTGPYAAPIGFNVADGTPGFLPIAGAVSNIQSGFDFSLTAGDIASGTSTFFVTPAPGTAALLGMAGLVAVRRRR